ncbi:MAG: hypothetical protein KAW12_05960 [Candidatus Aminicenantes bacterium]|nr:hypothetical protein [Candidatus Aminicenantes bacterium]
MPFGKKTGTSGKKNDIFEEEVRHSQDTKNELNAARSLKLIREAGAQRCRFKNTLRQEIRHSSV